jgi:polyisoprenoid-binding protein YceI
MNKTTWTIIVCVLASLTGLSQDVHLQVNKDKSKISWKGTAIPTGGHEGIIQLTSGSITFTNGMLKNGAFVMDMNSIQSTDMKGQGAQDLADHLKSDDFFSVSKFPEAYFNIVSAMIKTPDQTTITGILRIKDIVNTIVFPINLKTTGKETHVKASVSIDRTKWNITYQSKSILASIKDGAISDEIEITLDLYFRTPSE